jgi:hypothetical protein
MDLGSEAEWAGAIATFIVALVALFKDSFNAWLNRPRLEWEMAMKVPFGKKIALPIPVVTQLRAARLTADVYVFRFLIRNVGRRKAEQVQVFAKTLSRRVAGGRYVPIDFLSTNLVWSHLRNGHSEVFAEISPETGRQCDLGFIVTPKAAPAFGTHLEESGERATLAIRLESGNATIGPGTYRLEVILAAANCRPIRGFFDIVLTGEWFDSENQMFTDCVSICPQCGITL